MMRNSKGLDQCFPNFFHEETPKTIFYIPEESELMKTGTKLAESW